MKKIKGYEAQCAREDLKLWYSECPVADNDDF